MKELYEGFELNPFFGLGAGEHHVLPWMIAEELCLPPILLPQARSVKPSTALLILSTIPNVCKMKAK